MRIQLVSFLLVSLMFGLPSLLALQAQEIQTVALSDDVAFAGATFATFPAPPVINNQGEVAFDAFVAGPGLTNANNRAIFSNGAGGPLRIVARTGDVVPSLGPNDLFGSFSTNLVINDAGQTAFAAGFESPVPMIGIWSEGQGNGLELVAAEGEIAPGFQSAQFLEFQPIRFNNSGNVALQALTDNFAVGADTLWIQNDSGELNLVAQAGSTIAPGTNVPWTDFNFSNPAFNDSGQIAFSGAVFINPFQQFGIWRGAFDNITAVALPGTQAPGVAAGIQFDAAINPSINSGGEIAFVSLLSGPGINGNNNAALFSEGGGDGLSLVAQSGSAAPGTGTALFQAFFTWVLNDPGDTVFSATLTGGGIDSTNDSGVWRNSADGLSLVVRDGAPAAGTEPGVTFDLAFGGLVVNGRGQIAFSNNVTGNGINSSNDSGIWAEDLDGNLNLIARQGDFLEVTDDQGNASMRQIANVFFSGEIFATGNSDGVQRCFNDSGQLTFVANFTDGSEGIFVATIDVVLGDVNCDGEVNLLDVAPFVDLISAGGFSVKADINEDGSVNLLDVAPFVALLSGG